MPFVNIKITPEGATAEKKAALKTSRPAEVKWQLAGWLLFMVCAVLFIAAGLKNRDTLTVVGSVVFLVACFLFVIPILCANRSDS